MATILLSAAGAAIGGMATGPILGLSGAVVGRAVGATLGRVIDQRLMATGSGSEPVERGRVDRFRITGANEGAPIAQLFGRMRLSGQVIWATHFVETVTTSGGGGGGGRGKGAAPRPAPTPVTTTYSYSVSLALALCEGEIRRIGRIWADGVELDQTTIAMRVYHGTQTQMPDPLIAAVEGAGQVPAYRGIAYAVFEDFDLAPFGNRVPQFAFEVVRAAQPKADILPAAADLVRAVALMPGTGEYALATRQITLDNGFGHRKAINTNTQAGGADFNRALEQMRASLPNLTSVSLIYSWFGDDLRAGACSVRPKVEDTALDGVEMPWRAGGIGRAQASILARVDGRPIYGGTPADASVIDAIQAIRAGGQEVMLYPFLLMEILAGNGLPDPYGRQEQPPLPWRGRITGALAPGMPGSPDGTAANAAAVAAFFGTARARDFTVSPGAVSYAGPAEWSYSRFILHAAALSAAVGGVDAFCIGSEMRGLTQMRDATGFPAVARLIALAAEVRTLLPNAKLSYAADWSEYFGYQPQDGTGDVFFHLDALWADANIDFIAIDNYMPLSDWRDGDDHADANWGEIHSLDYLSANIEGGEGYDWYYPTEEARAAQRREPITDGQHDEAWTFRYKDLRGWWSNAHIARDGSGWSSLLSNGRMPLSWSITPGTTSEPVVGLSHGNMTAPVVITRNFNGNSRINGDAILVDPDVLYRYSVWYKGGTSGQFVTWLFNDFGSPRFQGDIGNIALVGLAFDHEYRSVENIHHGDGIWEFRLEIVFSGPTFVRPAVGPRGFAADTTVIFFGADLVRLDQLRSPWIPGSKPVRFTEIGCPAVDKGTNEPNKFFDPKSAESALPRHSNGRRDDLIQAQYLRAIMSYWNDPARNPISPVYGGRMLEMAYAHVWAWDARPWPAFPNETGLWSDGDNWRLGHWVTGRIEAAPLDRVVAELCEAAGMHDFDVSRLFGLVRGHVSGETESARARLQALMLAHAFQAVERDGKLVFLPLPRRSTAMLSRAETAYEEDGGGGISEIRAAAAEVVGRVRLGHVAAEAGYEDRVAEAVFPGDGADGVTALDLPMAMTGPEGLAVAERWLAEARIARDQLRLVLPPSRRALGAGEMVALEDGSTWRIDRIEDRGTREIEAVRVEPTSREPSDAVEEVVATTPNIAPVPVSPVFLDLPLLSGAEVEHAPHLAVSALPWPGAVAAYAAPGPDGFTLNRLIERRALIGRLVTPLRAARAGLWDRGAPVRVQLPTGQLSAAEQATVLNGANAAAIGLGDEDDWEVIQFADATLVGENLWDIGMRLRGQQGTDALMPAIWPEGSLFVVLDGAPVQIDLPVAARGLARHYRVGPALRAVDDASYVERVRAFRGVGLRPFAPAHLRARRQGGDLALSWVRRTRIDGDSWEGFDVPLGEASEQYLLRVWAGDAMRRETVLSVPNFTYSAAMRASDGIAGQYSIEVAQLSDRFGPGPFSRIAFDD